MGSVRSSSRGGSNQSSYTRTRLNHIPLGPSGFQWGLVVWLFLKALFFSHSTSYFVNHDEAFYTPPSFFLFLSFLIVFLPSCCELHVDFIDFFYIILSYVL